MVGMILCLSIGLARPQAGVPPIPYLEPSEYFPGIHAPVRLVASPVMPGTDLAPTWKVTHMFILSGTGRSNRDDFPTEAISFSDVGGTLVGCEFEDQVLQPEAANLVLDSVGVNQTVTKPMTVCRSAATIVRVGEKGGSIDFNRSGLKTELRAMSDPTTLKGGDLGLRFYSDEQESSKGTLVRAYNTGTVAVLRLQTDRAGVANIPNITPGTWRCYAAALDQTPRGPKLSIASLTFQIPSR